jgi:proteasome lid subunit RPN8/RPN11
VIFIEFADLVTVERIALGAAPLEACGLLEGTIQGSQYKVTAIHPSQNMASEPADRFEVDPRLLLRLQKDLRGGPTALVGIYHSHPRGPAAPSATDLAMAWQLELVWVITAVGPPVRTTAHRLAGDGFEALEISVTGPAG